MAKFCGMIGYSITTETSPGVWEDKIVERKYYGDTLKRAYRWQSGEGLNDNVTISNEISILADAFMKENLGLMKYIRFMGSAWEISHAEVEYPRIRITLGGLYNEQQD